VNRLELVNDEADTRSGDLSFDGRIKVDHQELATLAPLAPGHVRVPNVVARVGLDVAEWQPDYVAVEMQGPFEVTDAQFHLDEPCRGRPASHRA